MKWMSGWEKSERKKKKSFWAWVKQRGRKYRE